MSRDAFEFGKFSDRNHLVEIFSKTDLAWEGVQLANGEDNRMYRSCQKIAIAFPQTLMREELRAIALSRVMG